MDILQKAKKIKQAGGTLFQVGGSIRDELLDIKCKDKDYCVVGITEETFIKLFPTAIKVGKAFPVYLLENDEFAFARKEKKIRKGHTGFKTTTGVTITIEEDLKRRDITINSIAKNILTNEYIDPFNGIIDLNNKTIKHVSTSFSEDPLRVYRVARFASKLNFIVSPDTIKLMNSLKEELKTISPERVYEELKKALETDNPSIFFYTLKDANVLDIHFKEISDLIDVPQPQKYHPEGDVFTHTMIVLDKISKLSKDPSVRYAALLHDLGKAKTPKNILPSHYNHDYAGVILVQNLSNRLKVPKSWKKKAKETAKYHMKAGTCLNMRPFKIAKFFNTLSKTSIGIDNLELITLADDMLNRPNTKFSKLAHNMLKEINGDVLIKEGYIPDIFGIDKFRTLLLERQSKYISKNIDKF